ncbi:MAG TPA: leucyl aminopeptidase [Steroidobacteraceae bacterium]|nr:leucyl aminopeptidase [Steroidobacteraceae bacterium]
MQFQVVSGKAAPAAGDCAVVGVYDGGTLSASARELDRLAGGRLAALVERGDFTGKPGDTLLVGDLGAGAPARAILVGLGGKAAFNRRSLRRALIAAFQAITRTGARHANLALAAEPVKGLDAYARGRLVAELAELALYRIPDLKTAPKPALPPLASVTLPVSDAKSARAAERGIRHGSAIANGIRQARDLGNLPANVCTPGYLVGAARALGKRFRKLKLTIHGPAEIARLKMGAFRAVAQGSVEPAQLIVMEYRGAPRSAAPVVLVGKGITFDSGGISLKDPGGMDEMKFDMCGAASVFGALTACAELALPINVVGIVATCENMPDGRAVKPGDIVTTMSGQTVEVLNTDAEGRLILCDALHFARRFKPATVLDIATLTGACVIALGPHLSGIFTPDDRLAAELIAAGTRADDGAWRMPLTEDYAEPLKSNFADFANVGGREGGAVVAAAFLAKFTQNLSWAHLDIAGTAWLSGAQKSGTGRPVGLLVDFLIARAGA